jgi:hypothetical protein
MHCTVHEIMGSRNRTSKKGVKIEFSYIYGTLVQFQLKNLGLILVLIFFVICRFGWFLVLG